MEEEKVEVKSEAKKFSFKDFDFKNFNYKKYLPFAAIGLAVLVVIIILLVVLLGGGPKKAVKNFVNSLNSKNAEKVVKYMDFAGENAWKYSYGPDDFSKDDYKEFIEDYKDFDKDDVKEAKKDTQRDIEDSFDEISDEYKSFKFKVEKIKEVKKLGKDLYAVDAKISLVAKPKDKDETDEIDTSDVMTFIVYKNKIINGGMSLL